MIKSTQTKHANSVLSDEHRATLRSCIICGGKLPNGYYYGAYQDGGTCSRKCELLYKDKRISMIDFVINKGEPDGQEAEEKISPRLAP